MVPAQSVASTLDDHFAGLVNNAALGIGMRAILDGTVQPPALVLLNTASRPPISPLWTEHVGRGERCGISVVQDGEYPDVPRHPQVGSLPDQVVHIQSPRVGDTYLQLGGSVHSTSPPLGATASWLGMQIKPLGRRPLAVEVGLVDDAGAEGIVRFESWRTEPSLKPERGLICLPLEVPGKTGRVTEWNEFVVALPPLLGLFQRLRAEKGADGEADKRRRYDLPSQRLRLVSYLRVYANCRVRRVWLSNEGGVRREWGLWA